jgi:hypothetical protein
MDANPINWKTEHNSLPRKPTETHHGEYFHTNVPCIILDALRIISYWIKLTSDHLRLWLLQLGLFWEAAAAAPHQKLKLSAP